MKIIGRRIVGGYVEGEVLKSSYPISFYGSIDPENGQIIESGSELFGKRVTGKVFVFPTGKGSTVGSYVIYRMKKLGTAPKAIINKETEAIIATGCVMAGIPLVDKIGENVFNSLKNGSHLKVDADEGIIELF